MKITADIRRSSATGLISTSSDNVKKIRTGTKDAIVKQLEIALLFYPDIASMSFSEKSRNLL